MLLVLHLIFAFASIPLMLAAVANEHWQFTDHKKLLPGSSGVAFIGMVTTGTILVIKSHSPLLGACVMGLAYLCLLSVAYVVYKKLASKKTADVKVKIED